MSKALDYNKLWKILKEMGISEHVLQQLELDMEQQTGSK